MPAAEASSRPREGAPRLCGDVVEIILTEIGGADPLGREGRAQRASGKLDEVLGDLGAVLMEAMRVRRQRRRHPPAARWGAPGLCGDVVGFTVDLWEEGRAHPTWDHHGGVSPRARWVRQTGLGACPVGGYLMRTHLRARGPR
jgi:hypothetical protein